MGKPYRMYFWPNERQLLILRKTFEDRGLEISIRTDYQTLTDAGWKPAWYIRIFHPNDEWGLFIGYQIRKRLFSRNGEQTWGENPICSDEFMKPYFNKFVHLLNQFEEESKQLKGRK